MQGALPLVLTRRLLALAATLVLAPTVTYTVFTGLAGTLGGLAGIWHYVVQTFWHFDLGVSSRYRVPLTEVIGYTWPMDLILVVGGVLCGMLLGLAGGVTVVVRQGSKTAAALQVVTAILLSSPPYLLGFALLLLFAPGTGYLIELPFLGRLEEYGDMPNTFWGWIHELWLPWLLVGLPLAAQVLRMTASGIRDALGEDFVRTARAKGLTTTRIVRRHALPWAVAPIAALTAANMAIVITNVTLVESAFNLPGLFREVRDVQSYSDTPTVQALIIQATVLIVVANMLADAVQARLDPSVRR
jgi:ABC-type dipeptide/oligopeptide/nickel transport system permease component